jgi:hypothetical protein
MSVEKVQIVLKVHPRCRELLRRIAQEDRRDLSATIETLLEQEAARRLSGFTVASGDVPFRAE